MLHATWREGATTLVVTQPAPDRSSHEIFTGQLFVNMVDL